MPKLDDKKCLNAACGRPAAHNGLCITCWGKAKKLIATDKTTLAELARLGMVRLAVDDFEADLERRRADAADK